MSLAQADTLLPMAEGERSTGLLPSQLLRAAVGHGHEIVAAEPIGYLADERSLIHAGPPCEQPCKMSAGATPHAAASPALRILTTASGRGCASQDSDGGARACYVMSSANARKAVRSGAL